MSEPYFVSNEEIKKHSQGRDNNGHVKETPLNAVHPDRKVRMPF